MGNFMTLSITNGDFSNTHKINLPSYEIVQNPKDLKIKFYTRGKRYGGYDFFFSNNPKPRNDTQIYVNNKYFFSINALVNDDFKRGFANSVRQCYAYGLSVEEIKREFKIAYGRV